MPDIYDIQSLQKYMALFQGPNGTGKSIALGSFLDKGSIYYFDFDGRMQSVGNWFKQRGLKKGQLSYDTYGPDNLFDAMVKMNEFLDYCPHAVVAIDSFTALTVTAVMFQLKRRAGKSGKSLPTTSKGDLVIPDWDEYKGETVCVTQLLDMSKGLAAKGVAVIWTAHPIVSTKIEGDKYTKQTRYAAYGMKTDSLLPIYFDEIYNFATEWSWEKQANIRWCFAKPSSHENAKTALNLPDKFDWTDKNFYQEFSRLVKEGDEIAFGNSKQGESIEETTETNPFVTT